MRPINLIPPEDRRGDHAPARTGPLPYLLLAALVVVLVGVSGIVLLGNQISEDKTEVAKLEGEDAVAAARAQRLAAYTTFQSMSEQRVADRLQPRRQPLRLGTGDARTGAGPAKERVARRPHRLGVSRSRASKGGGAGSSSLRGAIPGPALELSGCATGQDAVAGFVTALKDIDGVTRVGVQSSELGEEGEESATAQLKSAPARRSSEDDECRTREFIAKFEIVVAFDAAPLPASGEAEGEAAPVPPPGEGAETPSTESSESTTASTESSE